MASFLVIGSVLVLLLIGGAYFVRHNLSPAPKTVDPIVEQNDETPDQLPGDDKNKENDKEDTKEEPVAGGNDSTSTQQPKEEAGNTTGSSAGSADNAQTTHNLPETGPGSSLLSGVALGILTAVTVAYIRSRQLLTSL